jgi:uncharacterized protein YndB with AHSA1/START domain
MREAMKAIFLLIILNGAVSMAQDEEKAIRLRIEINAPVNEVWNAWTTESGIKSFFAPDCKLDLRVDGSYEIYFNPDAVEGTRGGEGNKILAIEKEKLLSFTWNAPPAFPEIRKERTVVILRFKRTGEKSSILNFTQIDWGESDQWNQVFEYFSKAWGKIVLPRLKYRFEHGPLDWNSPPKLD